MFIAATEDALGLFSKRRASRYRTTRRLNYTQEITSCPECTRDYFHFIIKLFAA